MFRTHKITSTSISIKNLVLLFFTIVFWFASVITLADIEIASDINNARQTIAKTTITSDGTDSGIREMEISSWGIFINPAIIQEQQAFSWKVLGIDSLGNLVYVTSQNLIVSWANGGGDTWTLSGDDVYRATGNVGIGTNNPTDKLHVVNSWSTDVYIEEKAPWMAANLNLKNPIRSRAIWWDSDPDMFYVGLTNSSIYFAITSGGNVGIGTTQPKANLQVVGNFIAGWTNSNISWNNSSIAGGNDNNIIGIWSFIWWGKDNNIQWDYNFIWMWWIGEMAGQWNIISWSNYSAIVGWIKNQILSLSNYSFIPWGKSNIISGANYSFAWWEYSRALHNNAFVRNTKGTNFDSTQPWQFLINAPYTKGVGGGVGINTNNPQYALDVSGDINGQKIYWDSLDISWWFFGWDVIRLNSSTGKLCYPNTAGTIIYESWSFYWCNGSIRKKLDN